jgi:hypothetical protein
MAQVSMKDLANPNTQAGAVSVTTGMLGPDRDDV